MSRTAVVFGGPSAEHEISVLTGLQCEYALRQAGVDVVAIYWSVTGDWFEAPAGSEARDFAQGAPKDAAALTLTVGGPKAGWAKPGRLRSTPLGITRVLNCCHGGAGEIGGLQWLTALNNVACTGSEPIPATLGMDKLAFGAVMAANGIPSLPRIAVTDDATPDFDGPYIMKPRAGGSSIGITTVDDLKSAQDLAKAGVHYRGGAIIEPLRKDLFDLNVAYRTHPEFAVSLIEKPTRGEDSEFYGFAEKYLQGQGLSSSPRELPAKIPAELEHRMHALAKQVAEVSGVTGVVRVDFLSDGKEELYVNELNSIPGAMALYLWGDQIRLSQLLTNMLDEADALHRRSRTTHNLTGEALAAAGGIAQKLAGYRA